MHPVKRLRKQQGLKISDLVELTHLHRNTIIAIENGSSIYKTHQKVAKLLAKALGCEVSDIFVPAELSNAGRPPLTGGSYNIRVTTERTVVEYDVCPKHFIILPASGICDECS